ncbi:mandelate racemase/muconate lactonizing enzyme family protein [Paenibacillus mendelii]|uniref:Mandelate racemase/muconate lactonizing enzyme family protein n=1 Tax=Paenibacillus mendelii TaxID=206163 RepID=A0ABV6JBJ7_9BACL|nr:mandelate racemase/muconate lactonizing enzyme family protein [Paenibacillus mendelii]MCQ6560697.1 mandelate racemase/muconate lactonizing enzyme family protein [Paenibacillus mendelii]
MKILKIEAMGIRCPEPNDNNNIRHTMLVRVETEDGTVGWGEGIAMWPEAVKAVIAVVEGLSPLLIGKDALDTEANWQAMKDHVWWYGEGGIASFAISALDMALWDIKGKLLGVPLYRLLGGKQRDRLPACASIHVKHETHEENADEIAAYMDEGFQSVKVGFGKKGKARLGQEAAYDLAYVKAVRDRIGPDKGFIVDVGNSVKWDVGHAIRMTRAFEEYGVWWIEEPFHPSNIEAHRELRAATTMLIATGEREWTVDGYHRLLKTGIVDVVGIDPARVEGITAFHKIIQLVGAEKRKFNAHAWSTAITSAASLHLSISSPHCLLLELKPMPNPMQNELVKEPITQKDGWVYPLEAPGLGIEVDEEAVRKVRFM